MPIRKTSSEKKSAATRFLWMLWRLERSFLRMASSMKVISKASNEADTVAYVTIFSGNTSPCWVEKVKANVKGGEQTSTKKKGKYTFQR